MAEYGIGIVGCGMIAGFHASAIAEIDGVKLAAACSRSEKSARAFGEKHGIPWFTDANEMFKLKGVDIVDICTPSGARAEIAQAAAAAKRHIIVEKPIEVTLERADAVINACLKNNVKLCVIFPSRFAENSRLLKKALTEGRFGRLIMGDAYVKWFRTQAYYDSGGWRGTWKLDGGGALMNQSIHAIDLLLWFMGGVESVQAFTGCLAHDRIEVEDTAVAVLKFANGALGVLEGSTAVYPGFLKRIEISGDKGSVVLQDEDILTWKFAGESPDDEGIRTRFSRKRSGGGGAADPAAISHLNHKRQIEDFIQAVKENRPPLIDGREGRKAVELILAVYKSAETGRLVRLPL